MVRRLVACAGNKCLYGVAAEDGLCSGLLSPQEGKLIESRILHSLNASEGLFSTTKVVRLREGGTIMCGWVRLVSGERGFRTYPQNRPFAVSYAYTEGAVHDFRLTHYARVKQEAVRLYLHCADYGMHL